LSFDFKTAYEPNPENYFKGQFFSYRRAINWLSLPHLHEPDKKQERLNIEKKYGRNNPFTKSMLYGEFQGSDKGNDIFSPDELTLAKAAMRGANTPLKGDVRAAGDIANNRDKQVLMIREGTKVVHIDEHDRGTDIECGEYWVELLKALDIKPWQFTLDGGGLGSTVANYMQLRLGYAGLNVFHSNHNPTFDTQFHDRYTELHWVIKFLLTKGLLDIPFSAPLLADMRERQYVEMDRGKIKCEPKPAHRKRCEGRSPDFLDTLVYLFSDFPAHAVMSGNNMLKAAIRAVESEGPTPMELEAQQFADRGADLFGGFQAQPDLENLAGRIGIDGANLFSGSSF
jgi:hypothetical protein